MADIAQRFDLDMLVLTGPIEPHLAAQGVDVERDTEFMALVEPETVRDAYRLQMVAGTQVLVTATSRITPARLAHHRMEDRLEELAVAAVTVAREIAPQHTLVELWPCGLPLDASSAQSMKEHRDQYARVARVFEAVAPIDAATRATAVDGYLLGGFASLAGLKAAIAGIRMVSDRPIFASVVCDGEGVVDRLRKTRVEEAAAEAVEFGADVVGFATSAGEDEAVGLARTLRDAVDVPLMVTLAVGEHARNARRASADRPYATPEAMISAASSLRAAGVQFLRAGGSASPAYTAVLAACTDGLDVVVG